MLKQEIFVPYDVPVVFIDSVIPDGDAEDYEVEMFQNETRKVLTFMKEGSPYKCTDATCKEVGFTDGIPIYMDTQFGNRVFSKLFVSHHTAM